MLTASFAVADTPTAATTFPTAATTFAAMQSDGYEDQEVAKGWWFKTVGLFLVLGCPATALYWISFMSQPERSSSVNAVHFIGFPFGIILFLLTELWRYR